MSAVGYYRIKLTNLSVGDHTIWFYKNGAKAGSVNVRIKEFCENYIYIKYQDRYGRYRMFPLNERWESTVKATQIGTVNKLVTRLLDSQTSAKNIGYKNIRTISAVAKSVSAQELEILSEIYNSPLVYLYVGDGDDDKKAWVQVTVKGDGKSRKRNLNFSKVTLEIELPEYYSQTLK